MNDWARNTALANARATLSSTHELVRVIRSAGTEVGELSIAPRQAKELSRFLDAHRQAVQALLERAESVAGADELSMQGLVARQADLERAHSFVQSAFIDPRRSKEERQSLEAADWMCVEGFLRFVEPENGPIGPLVAVDPMRSPAVWDPGTSLPLPSLFRKQPEKLDREANPEESDRVLDYFPVVCLPSNLARSPEFYPLLSHEVGHAVDSTLGWSGEILRKLSASKLRDFWQSWMREMLADFVGLAVSGEAFALALHGYVRYMGVTREITAASSYPGIELRLAMLRDAIAKYDRGDCPVASLLDDRLNKAGEFSKEGKKLRTAYLKDVLPVLEQTLKFTPEAWQNEQTQTEELAGKLGRGAADTKADLPTRPLPFPLYSSAVALAKLESEQLDSLDVFRRLHTHAADLHRPDWVQSPSVWEFSVKTIPTLRPTLLASDGETKVPPKELLVYYDRIAFVAATNGQLLESLCKSWEKRQQRSRPHWERIEFYFCSDSALTGVERDGKTTQDLIDERNDAIKDLRNWLQDTNAVEEWSFHEFDGPLVFAAYYDWDKPGGRVHVSSQLLGTDLRKCPAIDVVWNDEVASPNYRRYCVHLVELRKRSRILEQSSKKQTRRRGKKTTTR